MKKWMLTFSCFFILFSCSDSESLCGGCADSTYSVTLNTTVTDPEGNSFKITDVHLENEVLFFTGDFVFNQLDSSAFFLSADGLEGKRDNGFDYEYYLSLDVTNQNNAVELTETALTFSGSWVLCFPVDAFVLSQLENPYFEESSEEKVLYAYLRINDQRAHRTLFYIPLTQIVSE